jgi:hypothetical protein
MLEGPHLVARCARCAVIALFAAIASCIDPIEAPRVQHILALHEEMIVAQGQQLHDSVLARWFEVVLSDQSHSSALSTPGQLTFATSGTLWHRNGDKLIAPFVDSWTTLTASANGQSATMRLGSAPDLNARPWIYTEFCRSATTFGRDYLIDSSARRVVVTRFDSVLAQGSNDAARFIASAGSAHDTSWVTYRIFFPVVAFERQIWVDTAVSLSIYRVRPDSIQGPDRLWFIRTDPASSTYVHPGCPNSPQKRLSPL